MWQSGRSRVSCAVLHQCIRPLIGASWPSAIQGASPTPLGVRRRIAVNSIVRLRSRIVKRCLSLAVKDIDTHPRTDEQAAAEWCFRNAAMWRADRLQWRLNANADSIAAGAGKDCA